MSEDELVKIVGFFVGPAIIAALVTWRLNTVADRHRSARDYYTKLSDSARDDVRAAVLVGVEYFSDAVTPASNLLVSKILMLDQEIRATITLLLESSGVGRAFEKDVNERLADFLDALTGGEFQSHDTQPSPDQVVRLTYTGSLLRRTIARERWRQLKETAIKSSVLAAKGKVPSTAKPS